MLSWKIHWLIQVLQSNRKCMRCGEIQCTASICDGEFKPFCIWCKSHGHLPSECPELAEMKCPKCGRKGKEGHVFRDCRAEWNPICYQCGVTGHVKAACPVLFEKEEPIDFERE